MVIAVADLAPDLTSNEPLRPDTRAQEIVGLLVFAVCGGLLTAMLDGRDIGTWLADPPDAPVLLAWFAAATCS